MMRIWDVGSGGSWLWSTNQVEGWNRLEGADEGWALATELGSVDSAPWGLGKRFAQALSAASLAGHVRAALVAADPLMTALGRPNREQVMTLRSSAATTLQALEMTNGKTLAEHLKRGAEKILETQQTSSRQVVERLFERALSRPPQADELQMSEELLGTPPKKEGLEDLLWAMAMLPEFQLIY
jgi:hypothetical protein